MLRLQKLRPAKNGKSGGYKKGEKPRRKNAAKVAASCGEFPFRRGGYKTQRFFAAFFAAVFRSARGWLQKRRFYAANLRRGKILDGRHFEFLFFRPAKINIIFF
jgi:hypothetical protein